MYINFVYTLYHFVGPVTMCRPAGKLSIVCIQCAYLDLFIFPHSAPLCRDVNNFSDFEGERVQKKCPCKYM